MPALRKWARKYPCIVPLRHPVDVALTWKKRRMNVAPLCDQYRRLVTGLDPLNPLYLPVDSPDREIYLDEIRGVTGLPLETDWPVWKSCGENGRFAGRDLELIGDIRGELREFFTIFGY